MSEIQAIQRQLKIKAGAAKRLIKEHILYRKEAEDQQRKVGKLIAEGISEDEWDLKNAKKVLDECNRMIDDSATRLAKAAGDVEDLVIAAKEHPELSQVPELLNAENVLKEGKELKTDNL
ncbi:tubulin binding cofactor A [Guyanagaster necrorhizus]|uniref:Tubulin-specific chaperone A n=1 Tax=Guyanagaster necrorhizus TaxID=856835 RepID=A0A9P7W6J4_9AGAR|nr:tubulin binding cofactor A [Guyanagaster necrorhizus MCA 3950]KAG7452171.1 tubulin binding cofactor A [Guyanagaster necrorhizus MCA 3950]